MSMALFMTNCMLKIFENLNFEKMIFFIHLVMKSVVPIDICTFVGDVDMRYFFSWSTSTECIFPAGQCWLTALFQPVHVQFYFSFHHAHKKNQMLIGIWPFVYLLQTSGNFLLLFITLVLLNLFLLWLSFFFFFFFNVGIILWPLFISLHINMLYKENQHH